MRRLSTTAVFGACLVALAAPVPASARQHASPSRPTLIDVPYLVQPPRLCGGAALSMVLRYWGARDIFPSDFSSLVDESEGGIRASALTQAAADRGWIARASASPEGRGLADLQAEVFLGRPVIVLIEDGVTRYHYVVVTGFTAAGVIFHDPARAPFRVIEKSAFEKEWTAADRWFMVVLPGSSPAATRAQGDTALSSISSSDATSACAPLVQEHVAHAKKNELALAEAGLRAATELCPADGSAWRELAGLKFVQKQYQESRDLAERATAVAPHDRSSLELLAGARFLSGEPSAALEAWNRIGEPRIDLVEARGLRRTYHAAVINRVGLAPRRLLTAGLFLQAERRTADLPTIAAARLSYQPAADGTADVTVVANERGVLPRGPIGWSVVGLNTLFRREIRLELNSALREGEVFEFAYRFLKRRPRGQFRFSLPSRGPLPGVTELEALWEGQFYGPATGSADVVEVRRRRLGVHISDWAAPWLKWQLGSSFDRFDRVDRFVSIEARAVARGGDRVSTTFAIGRWLPVDASTGSFTTASLLGAFRTDSRSDVSRLTGTAGVRWTSRQAPLPIWPVAGSSDTRGVLLRAHPLFDEGIVNDLALGRRLLHGGLEYERPVVSHSVGRLNAALFVDLARSSLRRLPDDSPLHADVGIGARIETPGIPGRLRLDLAHGLRDGRTALSAGLVAAWGR
jgi:hypothetical protein